MQSGKRQVVWYAYFKKQCTKYIGSFEIFNSSNYENIKDLELGFLGSVQNILKRGKYSLEEIVKMASYNPAEYIGINDRKGSLEPGKDADILVLDKNYDLICTVCRTFRSMSHKHDGIISFSTVKLFVVYNFFKIFIIY